MTYPKGEREILVVFGENVKRYYQQSDYKYLSRFAETVGLDTMRMKLIFNGEYQLGLKKAQNIVAALNVKTIDLMEDWNG